MIHVAPSILASNFSELKMECDRVIAAGADFIHFDVMDGHFVPNISMGIPVLSSLSKSVDAKFDVHLMIEEPLKYIDSFADAGAFILTFHEEVKEDKVKIIEKIKSRGVKAGLAIKPSTPIENLYCFLELIDLALIMTVEPGFGGQEFLYSTTAKIANLKKEASIRGLSELYIEVDGGINENTAKIAAAAGANVLVAGSCIFKSSDYLKAIHSLRVVCEN